MRLVPVPCDFLKNCKKLIVTNQYCVVLTGRSILIMTYEFKIIRKIDGLDHVYDGKVSPDGKKLLLISNGSKFYMVSLETLELLWQHRVLEGKYCNLEGKGIWTLDGNRLLFIIFDSKKVQYKIRSYNALDPSDYYDEDALSKTHRIHEIIAIPSLDAYVLLVQDLLDVKFDLPPRSLKFLVYQFDICQEYVLHSQKGIPIGMDYQENIKKIVVYTDNNTFSCDLNGDNIREITIEDSVQKSVDNPFAYYGMSKIKQIALSQNGLYVLIASSYGFDICDKDTGEILCSKEYGFGVENFTEIKDILVVCQYTGKASMYKIQE